jgi:hypothetical protein
MLYPPMEDFWVDAISVEKGDRDLQQQQHGGNIQHLLLFRKVTERLFHDLGLMNLI